MRVWWVGTALCLAACATTPATPVLRDTDQDGLVDAKDECPDVAGEAGGDGCPDAPQIVLVGGRIVIKGKIVFELNSAELGTRNRPVLDALAELLKTSTQVKRIEVQGHTDDTGEDDFNQQLSVQRAQSVKTALVQRGIATERLSVKGLGKSAPVAPNDTPEGRARNRRVELVVLE